MPTLDLHIAAALHTASLGGYYSVVLGVALSTLLLRGGCSNLLFV